ncbi:hypothetical protein L1O03_09220 [Corynebacterium uropygiale]|uniref:Uncharacterized protein n=1 Tax=Corynebacterium uropygiale TaxID=1775911 RepID=A0A9X1QTP6_9CORY|nr:hypothetical protein [Corynebacterium uropygiale]MCF4007349.1 hypothetical protein [Corynebacterium uropygiale]
METWSFHHPEHGLYELQCGYDAEFRALHPEWPGEDDAPAEPGLPPADASLRARFRHWRANPHLRVQVLHEGQPIARMDDVPRRSLPLTPQPLDEFTSETPLLGQRGCVVERSWDHRLLEVRFREGKDTVEWEPPAGSLGERHWRRRQSSALARVGFPMLSGLRRSGWAVAVLLLGPFVRRILEWLERWLPDLPDFPDIPAPPEIWLPVLPQVDIWVPTIPAPTLPAMPWWVEWLFEYEKIWLPLLLGVVAGVMALRNHSKSEKFKEEHGEGGEGGELSRRSPRAHGR